MTHVTYKTCESTVSCYEASGQQWATSSYVSGGGKSRMWICDCEAGRRSPHPALFKGQMFYTLKEFYEPWLTPSLCEAR